MNREKIKSLLESNYREDVRIGMELLKNTDFDELCKMFPNNVNVKSKNNDLLGVRFNLNVRVVYDNDHKYFTNNNKIFWYFATRVLIARGEERLNIRVDNLNNI